MKMQETLKTREELLKSLSELINGVYDMNDEKVALWMQRKLGILAIELNIYCSQRALEEIQKEFKE